MAQVEKLEQRFRLSRVELDRLTERFDWVLNARRSLLHSKLEKPLAEFRGIWLSAAAGVAVMLALALVAGRMSRSEP